MYTVEQMGLPTDQAGQDTVLVALNDSDTILGAELSARHWPLGIPHNLRRRLFSQASEQQAVQATRLYTQTCSYWTSGGQSGFDSTF
jgi:hypothetical protein